MNNTEMVSVSRILLERAEAVADDAGCWGLRDDLADALNSAGPQCKACDDTGVIDSQEMDELPGGHFVERGLVACRLCDQLQADLTARDERIDQLEQALRSSPCVSAGAQILAFMQSRGEQS